MKILFFGMLLSVLFSVVVLVALASAVYAELRGSADRRRLSGKR